MALMFPRLARNFIKNGYFPTDEPTLERALAALAPAEASAGPLCILDPSAGAGVAIADRDTRLVYVNEQYCRTVGAPRPMNSARLRIGRSGCTT